MAEKMVKQDGKLRPKTAKELARDKASREGRKRSERHEALKAEVFEMEKENHNKLIAFISRNNWYKLGGHSALIYYHRLAKRMDLNPRLNPDTDFFSRFKEGIVSIRNIETLEKNLKQIKIYRNSKLTKPGELYVFDLGYSISDEDLDLMYKDEEIRRKKLNQMVIPKVALPEVYVKMWTVTKMCYEQYRQMNAVDRQMLGEPINEQILRMQKCFILMANGNRGEVLALKEILVAEEEIKCMVKMTMELKVWSIEGTLRITQELVELERLVRSALKMLMTAKKK